MQIVMEECTCSRYMSYEVISSLTNVLCLCQTKNSLEIVPQPAYAHAQSPISSPIVQTRGEWEVLGNQSHQGGPTGVTMRNVDHDNLGGRNLPSTSR